MHDNFGYVVKTQRIATNCLIFSGLVAFCFPGGSFPNMRLVKSALHCYSSEARIINQFIRV
jgi:hypothetical protein